MVVSPPSLLDAARWAGQGGQGLPALEEGEGSRSLKLFATCFSVCLPAEILDESREEKEKSPPEHPAAPHTPPSTPVKLEEGELWLPAVGGRVAFWGPALAGRGGPHVFVPWGESSRVCSRGTE